MTITLQNQTKHQRRVLILGFQNVLMMDIAGPAQVFACANTLLRQKAYQIDLVTADGAEVMTDTGIGMRASFDFESVTQVDDFVIPGGPGVDQLLDDLATCHFIQRMAPVCDRIISICSGSLLAAAAGVLDGRCATSHWERAELARARFPNVTWQLDRIFTHDGKFHCSAGVTAGIDLALTLVEVDHSRKLALEIAREMVVFMRRTGGQNQYSQPLQAQSTSNLRFGNLYERIESDPAANWTAQMMADFVGTTERTLHRNFLRDLKISPSQFVEERRMAIARVYLENSPKSFSEIARLSGFSDEQSLRRSFIKLLGVLPSEYRQNFGTSKCR